MNCTQNQRLILEINGVHFNFMLTVSSLLCRTIFPAHASMDFDPERTSAGSQAAV